MPKDETEVVSKKEIRAIVDENDIFVKKKTLGDRIKSIFLADDIENVKEFAISDVIIPGIKNLIVDSVAMLILGDGDYRRRGSGRRDRDDRDRVSYNTRYKYGDREKDRDRKRRRDEDDEEIEWNEIIFKTIGKADDVLNEMFDLYREYEQVTLRDYYTICHYKSSVFDENWGWDSLKGVRIKRCRGGYILTLPNPISLD